MKMIAERTAKLEEMSPATAFEPQAAVVQD